MGFGGVGSGGDIKNGHRVSVRTDALMLPLLILTAEEASYLTLSLCRARNAIQETFKSAIRFYSQSNLGRPRKLRVWEK